MQRIDVTKEALNRTEQYIKETPEYDILHSIKAQLEFILESYKNKKVPTEEDKDKIIIGLYGIREFEGTDPEYADLLSRASYFYKNPEVNTIE